MITVAVDIMGSDREPAELLQGIEAALAEKSDLSVLVVGDEAHVKPFCDTHDRALPLVSTEVIAMDEHPATAVRKKKDASIVVAARAVKEGKAQGIFSAGSTGAVLTATTFGVGRIKGIKRPALAVALPGLSGKKTVFLDLGANADVHPESIVQFAEMGSAYAEVVLGVSSPRVALLSNGSEDTKGSEMALSYHAALKEACPNFVGNAEGTDLLKGAYDVIVGDGFTVNIALKTLEGTAKFLVGRIKAAANSSFLTKIGAGLLRKDLKATAAELSGDEYGGAVLLGLCAPVVKGHGSTSAEAVKNGTLAVYAAIQGELVDKIAAAAKSAR